MLGTSAGEAGEKDQCLYRYQGSFTGTLGLPQPLINVLELAQKNLATQQKSTRKPLHLHSHRKLYFLKANTSPKLSSSFHLSMCSF